MKLSPGTAPRMSPPKRFLDEKNDYVEHAGNKNC